MNYKAGAQAGASRCQRHHPAQTFRLVSIILELIMKASQVLVNWMRCPDHSDDKVQCREIWDEQAAGICDVEVARDAFDHATVVEAGVLMAGDSVGLA
jgi:hypothetical protein